VVCGKLIPLGVSWEEVLLSRKFKEDEEREKFSEKEGRKSLRVGEEWDKGPFPGL